MFPIVHHYMNLQTQSKVDPFMMLGSLYPDLSSISKIDRDLSHQMGDDFYQWCKQKAPEAKTLAQGVISHGSRPPGIDYYADEYWPGGKKGWCFQKGMPWMAKVAETTHLSSDLIWWKAHNFVEISLELITVAQNPQLPDELVQATANEVTVKETAELLCAYWREKGLETKPAQIIEAYKRAPQLYALDQPDPLHMAQKQYEGFIRRDLTHQADIGAMAELLAIMSLELVEDYNPFMNKLKLLLLQTMDHYKNKAVSQ